MRAKTRNRRCAAAPAKAGAYSKAPDHDSSHTVSHYGVKLYILKYMKTLIVELEDDVAAKLERVAPGKARQRSEFIRNAIRKALWEIEEQATAEAYRHRPDSAEDAYMNADVWEPRPKSRRTRSPR